MEPSRSAAFAAAATSHHQQQATRIVTSLIIEFTPIFGPRVKRTLDGNGDLKADQREWLVQFITKDLLHLQQLAMQLRAQNEALAAAAAAAASGGGAVLKSTSNLTPSKTANDSGGGINASSPVVISQRNSVSAGGGGGFLPVSHMSSTGSSGGGGGGGAGGSNLPTSASPIDEDDTSFVKVICLEQLNVAVVVMFFALEADEESANAAGMPSSLASMMGTHMYAVAVVLQDFSAIRLRVALPAIRDWLFNTYQEIMAMVYCSDDEDGNGGGGGGGADAHPSTLHHKHHNHHDGGGGAASNDVVDIEAEWYQKLKTLNPLIDIWISARVNRDYIDMEHTIFSRTTWSCPQLFSILIAALSHHRCILRADDAHVVNLWLRTLALFVPDDRLLFASTTCHVPGASPPNPSPTNRDSGASSSASGSGGGMSPQYSSPILAPDLNLQGTTAPVKDILDLMHYFRYPPVIIDVSKRLDEPCHFFPTGTLTLFTETRRQIFRKEAGLLPWENQHSRTRLAMLKSSSLLSTICSRLKQISQPQQYASMSNGQAAGGGGGNTTGAGGGVSNSSIVSMKSARTSVSMDTIAPRFFGGGGGGGGPSSSGNVASPHAFIVEPVIDSVPSIQKLRVIQDTIAHWRKQLLLRAMTFYVYEIELRREASVNPVLMSTLRISDSDHRILQVAVDFIAQVQEAKEKRVQKVLRDTFAF